MRCARLFLLTGLFAAGSCGITEVQPIKAANEYCDDIKRLVTAHADEFRSMRGQRNSTNYMDIWQTDFHLVGKSCEIWRWGSGQSDYACSKSFPNQEIAAERYEEAKKVVEDCLPDWTLEESPRKLAKGKKSVYQKVGILPVLSIYTVATEGLFRSAWSVYVFVGDPNDQL